MVHIRTWRFVGDNSIVNTDDRGKGDYIETETIRDNRVTVFIKIWKDKETLCTRTRKLCNLNLHRGLRS